MMTYDEAIQYLESIGKIGDIEKELSTDGWTVVALAELYKEREGTRSGDAQVGTHLPEGSLKQRKW